MPDYRETLNEVRECVAAMVEGDAVIDENTDLVEELGLASIEVMELVEQLEDRFDIAFPLNDLADVRTLADLARQVQQLTESAP